MRRWDADALDGIYPRVLGIPMPSSGNHMRGAAGKLGVRCITLLKARPASKSCQERARILVGLEHAIDLGRVRASNLPFCSIAVAAQLLSPVRLCNPTDCSTAGSPVHHCLPEFAQIHVR